MGLPCKVEKLTSSHMYPSACSVATLAVSSTSPVTLFSRVWSSSVHLSCRTRSFHVGGMQTCGRDHRHERRGALNIPQ